MDLESTIPWMKRHWLLTASAALLLTILLGLAWGRRPWPVINGENLAAGSILCFGDSLVAGNGADSAETAYPAQLGQQLGREVTAAGFPGATTADALARLLDAPGLRAPVVVVTLGGNDLLNRVPFAATQENLAQIFRELQRRGAAVVYTGVTYPLLPRLTARQRRLCRETGVLFVPDLLGGLLGNPALMADSIHPNGEGYELVAGRVASAIRNGAKPAR
ncbi:MAG: GDSL-type esterase/lipase family protein [Lentisphaeria bacterium]|jgi:lysophospholipase L1-like esterase